MNKQANKSSTHHPLVDRAKKAQKGSKWTIFFLICWLPYFFVIRLGCRILSRLFSKKAPELAEWYIRYFFTVMFKFKGLFHFSTRPIPEKIERPVILIALRNHNLSGFFYHRICQFPLLFPALKEMRTPKNWLSMANFVKLTTYLDGGLNENLENIMTIIDAGYSTLVYPHEGYVNQDDMSVLSIHEALYKVFLKRDTHDIYFVAASGLQRVDYASFRTPIPVQVQCISLQALNEGLKKTDTKVLFERIANYFGFEKFDIIPYYKANQRD